MEALTEAGRGGDVDLAADRQNGPSVLLAHDKSQFHGPWTLPDLAEDLRVTVHYTPVTTASGTRTSFGRMAVLELPRIDGLLGDLAADGSLVHVERIAARAARFAELATPLSCAVRDRLGIDAFWSHQAEAIDLVRAGRSVAIATGTASGKSLCFQVPVAEAVSDPIRPGTALLVFPTKALARDQLRAITDLEIPGLVAAAYDGDCTPEERTWVRRNANVVLTNPEMLHYGVLPHHARWATFLMRLRYVVLDELHAFRGVFGTHVAHVLRRLRRLCALYGANPTFICCSATIGAPAELASALWGLPVDAVTDDGSPRGERLIALWNPPLLDEWSGPHGRVVARRDRGAAGRAGRRRSPHDRLLPQPPRHRGRRRRRAPPAAP